MKALRAALFAAIVLTSATPALAHPTPSSAIFLDFTVDGARLEQDVPIEELERALHHALIAEHEAPAAAVARHRDELAAYALAHVAATTADTGEAWPVAVLGVDGHASSDGPRAVFHLSLRPPPTADGASLRLHVGHEVVSHSTTVYVRTDWAAGILSPEPRFVATFHAGRNDAVVVRARESSFARGLRGAIELGAEHIASGTDHLLFLFLLVIVAPLAAEGRRWSGLRTTREALLALARFVSAFTVGHSITLALGALGVVAVPSALVEPAIALSILLTALHAWRPVFPRREALLAGGFGLVHGLAFASAIAERNLGRRQAAWTLFGFNLGIELAQLALVAVVVPWVLLLSRTRVFAPFREGAAAVGAVLAIAWLGERTVGLANPTAALVAAAEARAGWLLVLLACGAIAARATEPEPT